MFNYSTTKHANFQLGLGVSEFFTRQRDSEKRRKYIRKLEQKGILLNTVTWHTNCATSLQNACILATKILMWNNHHCSFLITFRCCVNAHIFREIDLPGFSACGYKHRSMRKYKWMSEIVILWFFVAFIQKSFLSLIGIEGIICK